MKKLFLKPIALVAIFATTFTGCASSGENTETVETDIGTTEEPAVVTETENLANEGTVDYGNLFEETDNTESYDILALARTEDDVSTFVDLIDRAGLTASFLVASDRDQEFTLLLPTNEAFGQLSAERLEYLLDPQNKAELVKLINAHVIPSEVPLIQFNTNHVITSGENQIPVATRMNGTQVFVGGAQIVKPDIEASNGIIHIIDSVIDPSQGFSDETAY